MNGQIVSDLRGRLRVRLPKPGFTSRTFDRLSAAINKCGGIKYLAHNPLTTSLLIIYEPSDLIRLRLLSALSDFEPGHQRALAGKELAVLAIGEETPLPFNPVWSFILKRIFLPSPIRHFITIVTGIPYLFEGLKYLLWKNQLSVEVLDASALTVLYTRWDLGSAGTLLFFFSLSRYLEAWTRRRSISGLFRSLAGHEEMVWIKTDDGQEVRVKESELGIGTKVIVRSGGLVPVDGKIVEGEAMINQATMTGEPLAVRKTVGGAVFAGTAVEEGEIVIRADKVGGETRIRSIIEYIKESEASKTGLQGRAERKADAIVPYNFLLAGLIYLFTSNTMKAGNVLLVDYSCAIRLSSPLVVLTAMREGNENGILIKGGRYFEELARAKTVVFDKTGTLTEAKPEVGEIVTFKPYRRDEALRLAACLEEHFPHPVGRAVVRQAKAEGLKHEEEHTSVNYVVAHGISSTWHDRRVLLGSRHFVIDDEKVIMTAEEQAEAERLCADGSSLIYMAVDDNLAALISIKDRLRSGVKRTVAILKEQGVERIVMLTGDLKNAAQAMANEAGFTEFLAELLPDQKAKVLKGLRKRGDGVLMVGDGLNDSAALSLADVGVALSDGSELAKDVANVQLLKGRLDGLTFARELSAETINRIHSNYRIIVALNSLFLAMGLFGWIGPGITALLHNATTFMVALRATRPILTVERKLVLLPPLEEEAAPEEEAPLPLPVKAPKKRGKHAAA
ncbi:MAG: heavy metal translocating P-type ATPase [Deltaproteobacteria bacterium]|jgi:Cu2+-exporting ATPase|nr:heavy metal translocating P-type ATPase [Deltaproteobacteria bacterium]